MTQLPFFEDGTTWSSLTEVQLNDVYGNSAGSIDIVLVAYSDKGKAYDFGALEIQAVYISGNVREPFKQFMQDPTIRTFLPMAISHGFDDLLADVRDRSLMSSVYEGMLLMNQDPYCLDYIKALQRKAAYRLTDVKPLPRPVKKPDFLKVFGVHFSTLLKDLVK